ncbi:MAG: hypothetical protein KBC66_09940 [Kiritimatiellae bacterium]|jgi:hypothetical protein|nr:hypothetical protein [Kiritimatiellia bacterium]NLD89564.1 hypothetical protein [Lentisphaerota bacterium]HOU21622.1 hypothetical protein [Kiritimatiellia bacterium]HPC20444.1 hypothetical protein [Kiritimatiellia bacterium]
MICGSLRSIQTKCRLFAAVLLVFPAVCWSAAICDISMESVNISENDDCVVTGSSTKHPITVGPGVMASIDMSNLSAELVDSGMTCAFLVSSNA